MRSMKREKILLSEGFCYLEVDFCSDTKDVDGQRVKAYDKNGNPMLTIGFKTTDREGRTSTVYESFTPSFLSKITNLTNALGLTKSFVRGRQFDMEAIKGKCCAGVLEIEHHETYGPKNMVQRFLPIAFYKLLTEGTVEPPEQPEVQKPRTASGYAPSVEREWVPADLDDDVPF